MTMFCLECLRGYRLSQFYQVVFYYSVTVGSWFTVLQFLLMTVIDSLPDEYDHHQENWILGVSSFALFVCGTAYFRLRYVQIMRAADVEIHDTADDVFAVFSTHTEASSCWRILNPLGPATYGVPPLPPVLLL
eukprot:Skav223970  [mRNA]  locus=scaffold1107:59241:59639:- [translate_table: standard]